ncbi:hypothetical protein B0H17DRAFT_1099381 [Mycena rosella]|uniref:DUF6699 domain-containing protein n=1 Tax=Mycena rosella TaxID=1033263 RepID=A0AAD7CNH6_MYCRO|nr:hypothetical protein B0H17DRAFT_1099381 [Mycena rosella]
MVQTTAHHTGVLRHTETLYSSFVLLPVSGYASSVEQWDCFLFIVEAIARILARLLPRLHHALYLPRLRRSPTRSMDWQKDPWPLHQQSRNIDSLDTVWIPSPDSFERNNTLYGGHIEAIAYPDVHQRHGQESRRPGRNFVRVPDAHSGSRPQGRNFVRLFRALRRNFKERVTHISGSRETPQVSLSEWRAFGAHSRPTVNGIIVHNTFTPSPTPYLDVEEVFASLRSPSAAPFPWECQINPFLAYTVCGPAPVYWNIRSGALAILQGGPINVTIPLTAADVAQPATYPLLTHMYVSGLALSDSRFPWKFMVANPNGIRVRDVFAAILDNFQQLVFLTEYEKWGAERQRRAQLEWALRGGAKTQDGLRRMDYLCGQLFFRGLAPNPDRTGWVLFVGGEW